MKRVKVVWKFKRELGIRPMQYIVGFRDEIFQSYGNPTRIVRHTEEI
jgi:carbohydrate-binding DOMON domain-containing protein